MNTSLRLALVATPSLLLTHAAHAQCQLQTSARAVSLTWGSGPGDVTANSGAVTIAPAMANPSAWDSSTERGASGNCDITCLADYSGFHFTATGQAQTTGAGMFLSATGAGSINDRIFITSSTLPAGTPVSLRFSVSTTGQASVLDLQPVVSVNAGLGPCVSAGLTGFGSATQSCTSNVGGFVDWPRTLSVTLSADRIPGVGPITSTLSADVRVLYTLESLTPGVTLTSCSGHDYTPPCPADLDNGTGSGTRDNAVDINDLLFFLTAFESGSTAADLDNGSGTGTPDGGVDINDLLFFLVRFEAGC
jgi:hypothetical protein